MEKPLLNDKISISEHEFLASPISSLKKIDFFLFNENIKKEINEEKSSKEYIDFQKSIVYQFQFLKASSIEISPNVHIIDFSLKRNKKVKDDEFYLLHPELINILFRGLCVMYNSDSRAESILRRGLSKFFSLSKYMFSNRDKPLLEKKDGKKHKKLKGVIFDSLKDFLLENKEIQVIASKKFNGVNVQISFCKELGNWVIGSKNVTLLTTDFSNLSSYQKQPRYEVACKIAENWKQQIEKLSSNLLDDLKNLLSENKLTLLGEFCGEPSLQHIIVYPNSCIYFYAIVKNDSCETCIDPEKAMQTFSQFNLPFEKPTHSFNILQEQTLESSLKPIIEEINDQSCSVMGEGAVLYFFGKNSGQSGQNKVLLLTKVKTYEYMIFRKLRESLRCYLEKCDTMLENFHYYKEFSGFSKSSQNEQNKKQHLADEYKSKLENLKGTVSYKKYIEDFEWKMDSYKSSLKTRSNGFYKMMINFAFIFASEVQNGDLILNQFGYFLNTLFYCCENCELLSSENYKTIFEASRRCIEWNSEFRKIEPHVREFSSKPLTPLRNQASHIFDGKKKHVKVFLPVMTLGAGKSYFFEHIHPEYTKLNYTSYLISSDELSWYLIQKLKAQNSGKDRYWYFKGSRRKYKSRYAKILKSLLSRVLRVESKSFCFLIDKNHHPFHVKTHKKDYEETLKSIGVNYDFVILYIKVENPLADHPLFKKKITFPLNFKIFTDSFLRMNNRKNVLMQEYKEKDNLQTLVQFFDFFCNFRYYTYHSSTNVFISFYDESNSELNKMIEGAIGPLIADLMMFERFEKKVDDKELTKSDYAENFLNAWYPFYAKNKKLIDQHSLPDPVCFAKSIEENKAALFEYQTVAVPKSKFNFEKISYFGIFLDDEFKREFVDLITKMAIRILKGLNGVDKPSDCEIGLKELEEISENGLNSKYWFVPNHHLTIVYANGSSIEANKEILLEGFEENKFTKLEISHFVFIPSRIAFFIVYSPNKKISENKIPHITLFKRGKYAYKDSNDICEILLQKYQLRENQAFKKQVFYRTTMKDLYFPHIVNDVYIFGFPPEPVSGRQKIFYF